MVKTEIKYKIFDLTGEYAFGRDEGEALHAQILPAITAGQPVELDFVNIKIVIGHFLSGILGDLYEKYTPEQVDHLIKFVNLDELGERVLVSVKRRAIRYASFDNETRQKIAESREKMYWSEG